MGIQGLLKTLKPFTEPVNISKYSGSRVGIDAYCWLHKGAYACNIRIFDQSQNLSVMDPCINYCMHRINMLKFHNITPVVVFDGCRLPSKANTENDRQRRRDQNLEQARCKLSQGDVNGAEELYQRAVEITPRMAYEFIKVLKAEGVEFVVAPYEADAQLAYLSNLGAEKGGVSAVISEDSDLLAYGCEVVIFKMDRYGNGEEVKMDNVMNKKLPNSLSFGCFTQELFTGMCVLAGCDFLPSVQGIGIKRAHGLVSKYRDLNRVLSMMRFDRKLSVPEDYEVTFKQANAIFRHARIYDMRLRKLSFLKPLSADILKEFNGELDFLGPDLPLSRAIAIAEGRLDPISMSAFDESLAAKPIITASAAVMAAHNAATNPVQHNQHVNNTIRPCPQKQANVASPIVHEKHQQMFTVESRDFSLSSPAPPTTSGTAVLSMSPDSGFLSQLKEIAKSSNNSIACRDTFQVEDYQDSFRTVTLSPGKKRVLPLPPNNNPFKKGKANLFSIDKSTEEENFQKIKSDILTSGKPAEEDKKEKGSRNSNPFRIGRASAVSIGKSTDEVKQSLVEMSHATENTDSVETVLLHQNLIASSCNELSRNDDFICENLDTTEDEDVASVYMTDYQDSCKIHMASDSPSSTHTAVNDLPPTSDQKIGAQSTQQKKGQNKSKLRNSKQNSSKKAVNKSNNSPLPGKSTRSLHQFFKRVPYL